MPNSLTPIKAFVGTYVRFGPIVAGLMLGQPTWPESGNTLRMKLISPWGENMAVRWCRFKEH